MPVLISLLRGVNVGGKHMVPMAALRESYAALGMTGIATFLQSGNVVFRAPRVLAPKRFEDAIEERFGFRVPVILRTAAEMRDVVARNPFPNDTDPAKLLVVFLAADPGEEGRRRAVEVAVPVPEDLRVSGRELFIHFVNGLARPKLSTAALDRALGAPGTGRNWNTVRKLAEMATALEATSAAAR
jgi:uncharacterized protein (DUF1697 family)